ncbi:MAG: glycine cleavage system aminomethyltransferase T, partial [Gammaproteobacteria bacterium]
PILRNGEIVGHLTSGNYGHTLGGSVGLGYVEVDEEISADYIAASNFEINVGGDLIPAKASLGAMYDPKATRMRE